MLHSESNNIGPLKVDSSSLLEKKPALTDVQQHPNNPGQEHKTLNRMLNDGRPRRTSRELLYLWRRPKGGRAAVPLKNP